MRSRLLVLALALSFPLHAFAQDDLLAPLVEDGKKGKKPKKKSPPKAEKNSKQQKGTGNGAGDEDMLESLVQSKTELLVKVPASVKGAKLFVDGKDLGVVSGGAVEAPPGEHMVTVKRPGFADFSKKVSIEKGKLTEVAASLDPVAGVLTANVTPADSEVVVDGKTVGLGSLKDVPLIPGTRTIIVRRAGMQEERQSLNVKAGKDYTIDVTLKPAVVASNEERTHTVVAQNADRPEAHDLTPNVTENNTELATSGVSEETSPPVYKRWYVWAGVVAVAAGAVAVGVATSSGGGKTVTTSQICGPSGCDAVLNAPKGAIRF